MYNIYLYDAMSTNLMQEKRKGKTKGMQFITRMTTTGGYFYLRIPKERSEQAQRYFDNKSYLMVNFSEIEEGEGN